MSASASTASTGGTVTQMHTRARSIRVEKVDIASDSDRSASPTASVSTRASYPPPSSPGVVQLLISVGGIYVSFLTWAVLQERISTTPYGPEGKFFRYSLVINTVQSFCAAIVGFLYTLYSSGQSRESVNVFPNRRIVMQYTLVAATSSLASPFGYASLNHIDYLTLLLGKSCKLLPVMALHVILFRRKYSWSKYMVVLAVTCGVSMFTLYHPSASKKAAAGRQSSSAYGLFLLTINLLFDGLTNSTQDHIFRSQPTITGPKMMCGINVMSTFLTGLFLLSPFSSELSSAIDFFRDYPSVLRDIVLFAVCGAIGQVFIFYTLSKFGSLTLVTVTVTRKMMSMLLSVAWFNHSLSLGQWLGVLMVFGGVGGEALTKYLEKKTKANAKRDDELNGGLLGHDVKMK
ncbi:UAA transporter family-domain-containing protein [Myxozyma melibiosi]|uniref:UDP-galactose transporter homolog 1 n=1 Tax=Myxozyma melibiosi TaxID=54550 RepID=A0ABR1F9Q3_9ASCO